MTIFRTYPTEGVLTRPVRRIGSDVAVFAGAAALLWVIIALVHSTDVPWTVDTAAPAVSTDPGELPYYAGRSLLRMFVALGCSLVFTFVYATVAARSRRAEKVLIPLLDILQSVPILGFLSVTITGFIALFPGSELGLECASIFAIFTSQAWNMTFAFYSSLVSQPRDLDEASRLLRLSRWQRFWRVDLPSGMIPLVWNGMMSFGGGWFFLTASEALSVNNHNFALPGVGAYVAAAGDAGDLDKVLLAVGVMIVMVVGVNLLFWRPLTAWAERFRLEDSGSGQAPRSLTLELLRRSSIPRALGRFAGRLVYPLDRVTSVFGRAERPLRGSPARTRAGDWVFGLAVGALVGYGVLRAVAYIGATVGFGEIGHALLLGLATFARVLVLIVVATVVWVPVGVWIGLNPKVSRLAQPVVQILASFPANFLFPMFTAVLLVTGISLDVGGIVLMALGAQWYILFNVIAGASAIPNDLREAAANLRLTRMLRWRKLIAPAIFSSYVTGGITAAGGAWNASIVAEVVTYHGTTLTAAGLGAYIRDATADGDAGRILVGVIVMSVYVVAMNRLLWRRLYAIAQRRYSLA
ncbi:binding-protein-dependent transport system inner membrane protein [Mycolicibacterium canariasense]|uniref:Binding-protein-dependent transport system inner membrane protein n=1 Tax=Mycolicibacterium canariasense TaxID=228230 RepID=A0A117IBU2_MYCCR|nr:ABC transporter permease subunit [Mycolicibacterium canariasense]MCV7210082.1 ABC transporter permease subunit [Mycolicibacterium canariasense]ORV13404.1 sulfonate ABC transporter permease [Mycolicibacterium canariasense]GAS98420.1 binding-protein-dependent transport system inner membrane protein [Mycolicibacterium canariasense]